MRPKAKYHAIYAHRDQYPVQVMCRFFEVSRSGYYASVKRLGKGARNDAVGMQYLIPGWKFDNKRPSMVR